MIKNICVVVNNRANYSAPNIIKRNKLIIKTKMLVIGASSLLQKYGELDKHQKR